MVKKFAAALAIVAGGVALAPTAASAQCWGWGCTYYTYGYVPSYQTAFATYNQPVLVKKPVTTYVYAWSAQEAYCVVPGSSIFGTWEMVAA